MVIFENVTASVLGGRCVHDFSGDHVVSDHAELVCLHRGPADEPAFGMNVPGKLHAFHACRKACACSFRDGHVSVFFSTPSVKVGRLFCWDSFEARC
jgi:hypothetical protein